MSERTFKVAGYSTLEGVRKMRVAKDMKRAMVLERNGHKDIVLYELPQALTKEQCAEWLASGKFTETAAAEVVDTVTEVAEAIAQQAELTFEEALARVALRNEKGHFIKREVREAMARELMTAA